VEIIKKLQKDYGYDILAFIALLIIFTFLAHIFVAHQGNPIVDSFVGPFISSEMLKGGVLYKDIFIPYGPFAYQLNSFLFIVFGEHLNTLYAAGIVNSLVILSTIYLIARSISSRWVAFTVSFIIMTTCVFHYYIFNYIFPYSPAISYALTALLLSLLFLIYYLKTSNPIYTRFSFLFISISMLSKLDFSLFLIPLLIIVLFLKPITRKDSILNFAILIIIPLISWGVLFLQGLTLSDMSNYLYHFDKFIKSPLMRDFSKNYTGLYPTIKHLKLIIDAFVKVSIIFITSAGFIYLLLSLVCNKYNKIRQILTIIFVIIALVASYFFIVDDIIFSWIAITTMFILVFLLLSSIKKEDLEELTLLNKVKKIIYRLREISLERKILILILIAGLLASFRSSFLIDLHSFGTFLLPLILLGNIIFLIDYVPNYIKILNKDIWEKACSIILISIALTLSINYIGMTKAGLIYPISTAKGTIYTVKEWSIPFNGAIDYINKEMPKNATFIMMPQGPALNFLTDHPSHGWYHDLIPPALIAFEEPKILKNLRKNPPDYIFVNNRNSGDWGFAFFGKDYAFRLSDFILDNYKLEKKVGKDFFIKIYKRKDLVR